MTIAKKELKNERTQTTKMKDIIIELQKEKYISEENAKFLDGINRLY